MITKPFVFDFNGKPDEQKTEKLPCQNCGKLVMVVLPLYGCVFCSDCIGGESYEQADAPEFKRKYWRQK